MVNKSYFKLSFVGTLLIVVTATLLFSIVTLRLGTGFGREVNMIFNAPPQSEALRDFVDELKANPIEVHAYELENNQTMIKLIGVNDIQIFLDSFHTQLTNLSYESIGTFGTLSSISNFIKLFQIYFVVFLFGYVIFSSYRNQMTGLTVSLSVSVMLVFALFIINSFGFLLNNVTWFSLLIGFSFLVMQKKYIVRNLAKFFKQEPEDYDLAISTILKNSLYVSAVMAFFGLILVVSFEQYINAGILFITLAVMLVIERILLQKFLPTFIRNMVRNENLRSSFVARGSLFEPSDLFYNLLSKAIVVVGILIIVVSGVSRLINPQPNPGFGPSKEHILIVDNSEPVSFLEVQASLYKYGLEDNLSLYRVSEEKSTWFKFEGLEDTSKLEQVKADILDKTFTESSIYSYKEQPKESKFMQLGGLASAVLLGIVLLWSLNYKRHRFISFVVSLGTTLLFIFFSDFLGVLSSDLFYLALLAAPLLTGTIFYIEPKEFTLTEVMNFLKGVLSVVSLVVLPMVVIIPFSNSEAYTIIGLFIAFAFALGSTTLIFHHVEHGLRRGV